MNRAAWRCGCARAGHRRRTAERKSHEPPTPIGAGFGHIRGAVDTGNDLVDWSGDSQRHWFFDLWRGGWSALVFCHALVDALGGKAPYWRFLISVTLLARADEVIE